MRSKRERVFAEIIKHAARDITQEQAAEKAAQILARRGYISEDQADAISGNIEQFIDRVLDRVRQEALSPPR